MNRFLFQAGAASVAAIISFLLVSSAYVWACDPTETSCWWTGPTSTTAINDSGLFEEDQTFNWETVSPATFVFFEVEPHPGVPHNIKEGSLSVTPSWYSISNEKCGNRDTTVEGTLDDPDLNGAVLLTGNAIAGVEGVDSCLDEERSLTVFAF